MSTPLEELDPNIKRLMSLGFIDHFGNKLDLSPEQHKELCTHLAAAVVVKYLKALTTTIVVDAALIRVDSEEDILKIAANRGVIAGSLEVISKLIKLGDEHASASKQQQSK